MRRRGSCLLINNYLFFEETDFSSSEDENEAGVRSFAYSDSDSSDDDDELCDSDSDDDDDDDEYYSTDDEEEPGDERTFQEGHCLLKSSGLSDTLGKALYGVGFNIHARPNRTTEVIAEFHAILCHIINFYRRSDFSYL